MATVAVLNAMSTDDQKSVHPFFQKPNGLHKQPEFSHETVAAVEGDTKSGSPEIEAQADGTYEKPTKLSSRGRRKNKSQPDHDGKGKKQRTLQDLVDPMLDGAATSWNAPNQQAADLCSSDPVAEHSRRKRRRTSQLHSVETGAEVPALPPSSPRVVIPMYSPVPMSASPSEQLVDEGRSKTKPRTPPRKLLRLNANGRFSSPISRSKEQSNEQPSPAAPKKRGRPRKSKDVEQRLIVKITYGKDATRQDELSNTIRDILLGERRLPTLEAGKKPATPKKQRTPRQPNKPTHPFFVAKPLQKSSSPKEELPRKASAVTPGKLRMQTYKDRRYEEQEVSSGVGPGLLKDRLMVKHPGAKEPSWPDREQAHVRGLRREKASAAHFQGLSAFKPSKRKQAPCSLAHIDSLLGHVASRLVPEPECQLRPDGFSEAHSSIRMPQKLLLSGINLRDKVSGELSVSFADTDPDQVCKFPSSRSKTHFAVQKLWKQLPNILTPLDETMGETLSWAQKYSPQTAAEVLQPVKEMSLLKEWLISLTITAVGTASKQTVKVATKSEPKTKKKPRRRNSDLDDFLVDSDDEVPDMDELTDPNDVPAAFASDVRSSVVQVSSQGMKFSNAVLLSGPHGCGKTAAAYAVAKELGFKVFEINSCERRSGRDVLDKVGDMTENHLVKHHGTVEGEQSGAEEPKHIDEAFQRDLASGRQGMMNAFFKPQAKVTQDLQKKATKKQTLKVVKEALKKPAKDQQQSLILLEEVDVLFRDDKEFWTTVLKLIATSKRAFIMTCNDEDLVPLQAMSLRAILRFTPPAVDLATDYMLLLAAAEGHLVNREAVVSLYEAKAYDLRACLAQLNFWCQMGVGDPKCGLSWVYQRWPIGSDVDEHGRKLRVVSEGTFETDMDVLPSRGLTNEDAMLYAWQEYDVAPADILGWHSLTEAGWHAECEDHIDSSKQRLLALNRFISFAESFSCIDACTAVGLPGSAPLDTTMPEMTDTARSHYIEGLPLLQTDEYIDYVGTSQQLAVSATLATYSAFGFREQVAAFSKPNHFQARIRSEKAHRQPSVLSRRGFACLDPISVPPEAALSTTSGLTLSSLDGPLEPLATDIAPYLRSIVQYDLALEQQRESLSRLMADGDGRRAKRARTTRAARSALEGSQRASTRRERWFTKELDLQAVLATGGESWPKIAPLIAHDGGSTDGELPVTPASSAEVGSH